MTTAELAEMSPAAKRIAIAEACGWRFVEPPTTHIGGYWESGQQGVEGYGRGDWGSQELGVGLPDYLADLNAMHEAEKTLTPDQHFMFRRHLWELTDCTQDRSWAGVNGEEHNRRYCSATAAQRADAFLLTLSAERSAK